MKPYTLETEGKEGEFFLNDDITNLRNELGAGKSLEKLKIALGVSAKIDEARSEGASDYETLEEAAKRLGIEVEVLGIYTKKGGPLSVGNIGIVNILTKLINKSYNTNFSETDIANFCERDERYKDVRKIRGILNLDDFIENTFTLDEAREEVSGEGWLAEKIFEHCFNEVEDDYFKIDGETKIHKSYVDVIKHKTKHMGLDIIRKEIGYHLTGIQQVIPKQYGIIISSRDKEHIAQLTAAVTQFKKELYNKAKVGTEVSVTFPDDVSFNELMRQTAPRSIVFSGNLYHNSDVEKLKLAIENSATKLKVTKQSIVQFSKEGYIGLCEKGISKDEVNKLIRNSHPIEKIIDISKTLSQEKKLNKYLFSYGGKKFCHGGAITKYVRGNPVTDITNQGMIILARKTTGWEEYMTKELNKNGNNQNEREKVNSRIIKYLMNDLNITTKNNHSNAYTGIDFTTLNNFQKLLQKYDVHRIASFKKIWKRNGFIVDSENSYYTREEVIKILGKKEGIHLNKTRKNLVTWLRHESPQGDSKYNEQELYRLIDTAKIVRKLGDDEIKKLSDPLEILLMYKLKDDNSKVLKMLQPEFNQDGSLNRCNKAVIRALGDFFKIGGGYDNIQDSMCYQKIESAFRRLKAA